jgi:hypothetical protein
MYRIRAQAEVPLGCAHGKPFGCGQGKRVPLNSTFVNGGNLSAGFAGETASQGVTCRYQVASKFLF